MVGKKRFSPAPAETHHGAHRVLRVDGRVVGSLRAELLTGSLLLRDRVERGVRALSGLVTWRRRVRVSSRVLEVRRRDGLSLVDRLVVLRRGAVRAVVVLLGLLLLAGNLLLLLLLLTRLLAVRRRHATVAREGRSSRSRLLLLLLRLGLEEVVRRLREGVLGRLVVLRLLEALVRRVLRLLVLLLLVLLLLVLLVLRLLLLLDRGTHRRLTRDGTLLERASLLRLLLLLLLLLRLLLLLGLLRLLLLLLFLGLLLRRDRTERGLGTVEEVERTELDADAVDRGSLAGEDDSFLLSALGRETGRGSTGVLVLLAGSLLLLLLLGNGRRVDVDRTGSGNVVRRQVRLDLALVGGVGSLLVGGDDRVGPTLTDGEGSRRRRSGGSGRGRAPRVVRRSGRLSFGSGGGGGGERDGRSGGGGLLDDGSRRRGRNRFRSRRLGGGGAGGSRGVGGSRSSRRDDGNGGGRAAAGLGGEAGLAI